MPPAPAAEVAPAAPLVYVTVSIPSGRLIFEDAEGLPGPSLTLDVSVPGVPDVLKSAPVEPAEDEPGLYRFGHSSTVELAQGLETLHRLLNQDASVMLSRDDGTLVGSCRCDLAPFAFGADGISTELAVAAAEDAAEPRLAPQGYLSVGITLTQDPPPPPAEEADAEAVNAAESGADAEPQPAEAGAEGDGRVPYVFVDPEAAKRVNVLELQPVTSGPLPKGLQTAAAAMAPNALRVRCALLLPQPGGEPPHAFATDLGSIQEEEVVWARPKRHLLLPEAASALEEAVENRGELVVELARFMDGGEDKLFDAAFSQYHALAFTAKLCESLAAPGCTEAVAEVALGMSASQALGDGRRAAMTFQEPEKANPKAKPIEPPAQQPPDAPPVCHWADAGTSLVLNLKLHRPVVPAWEPPPKPEQTLQELIPKREPPKKIEEVTAQQEYQDRIRQLAVQLATQYHQMFKDDVQGPEEPAEDAEVAARHKRMIFELNRSGQYLDIKNSLKKSVVRIVKEKYRRSGEMSREEMHDLYNDLYVCLLDQMHLVLSQLAAEPKRPAEPPQPGSEDLARLKALADEYEVNGDWLRASKNHQQRLIAESNAQVWYDYGTFCMRQQQHGRAEEAFREALALDPHHLDSLLALAGLLLHSGCFTDPAMLENAQVLLHSALEEDGENGLTWALLTLVFASTQNERSVRDTLRNCRLETRRLGNRNQEEGAEPLKWNPFLQAALHLLDLRLASCGQKALAEASSMQESASALEAELLMCSSRAHFLLDEEDQALADLKAACSATTEDDLRPHVLAGNIHFRAERLAEAQKSYETALHKIPAGCPLELFLNLASCFSQAGQLEYALDVFRQACVVRPCASAWLGVGTTYFRQGDFDSAELALSEANLYDNHHPAVWGYLALLSALQSRDEEADEALKLALKEGLEDAPLLVEIGRAYYDRGLYATAAKVLKLAAKQDGGSAAIWQLLAQALLEAGDVEEAARLLDEWLAEPMPAESEEAAGDEAPVKDAADTPPVEPPPLAPGKFSAEEKRDLIALAVDAHQKLGNDVVVQRLASELQLLSQQ